MLLTTKHSVSTDPFTLNSDAQHWLSYEDDLNAHCSTAKYGNSSKGITARSITLEDINRVTGYTEPSFTEYTFGTEQDYEHGKVNYYYPTTTTATAETYPYWKKATGDSDSKTFTADEVHGSYSCYNSANGNLKYIIGGYYESGHDGDDEYYTPLLLYPVASRSIRVRSRDALFRVAGVLSGYVDSGYRALCSAGSSGAYDEGGAGSFPVRPIAILPSGLQVQEGTGGSVKI